MTDCFIIFFQDKDGGVNFYDIKLNSSANREVLIQIMNIEEIDYSISSYKDLIVTDKAPIVSQFVTSASEIFISFVFC